MNFGKKRSLKVWNAGQLFRISIYKNEFMEIPEIPEIIERECYLSTKTWFYFDWILRKIEFLILAWGARFSFFQIILEICSDFRIQSILVVEKRWV